jgi:hypothetical protein
VRGRGSCVDLQDDPEDKEASSLPVEGGRTILVFLSSLLIRLHTDEGTDGRVCARCSELLTVRDSETTRARDEEAAGAAAGAMDVKGRVAGRELFLEVVEEVVVVGACVWDETVS